MLNSNAKEYGGDGLGNPGAEVQVEEIPLHGRGYSISLTLPPFAVLIMKRGGSSD
ncbi:MAG: alpha amylase C-terminal domain-containing protein [Candidatus Omnitrophica bacterium]|nr:alpha amylase C-terminal domain-containing protein [Candidatus Omnitrophota bacterium]